MRINSKRAALARVFARRSKERKTAGSFLVEALFACLIVGVVTSTLVMSYSQLQQATVHTQSELDAIGIAQECIDELRVQQFTFLEQNLGVHNIPVVGGSSTGDPVFPRPLLRDTTLTYYNKGQVSDQDNYLRALSNQAVVTLSQDPDPQAIDVTVVVQWSDGQQGNHSYTIQTILSAAGLNG